MKCPTFSRSTRGFWVCCLQSGHDGPHEWIFIYIGKRRKKIA